MGCYGIGIERTLQAIAETHRDGNGIMWPQAVAPFQVHLLSLNNAERADALYDQLCQAGIEVLYDDRPDVSAGIKFADADLIGSPVRLVVSKRTGGKIEWKRRTEQDSELLDLSEVMSRLQNLQIAIAI
jgi:prolyl-tRNA synthetase